MKYKVYSSQYNNLYGNNQLHFPYSISCLASYCMQFDEIEKNFDFKETFVFKFNIKEDIEKAKDADILLCSCYSWNWEVTKVLAKTVKEINPKCLIIFGGPEIPKEHFNTFFLKHPFVDIIVHGEGEITLYEILKKYISGLNLSSLDILGIETKFKRCNPRGMSLDITNFPSPYLTNWVWKLSPKIPEIKYIVLWETNRGCPFSCTYCDWGSATMSKLRIFSEQRIHKEIEWFKEKNIPYIECCDGNFGILQQRDYDIAIHLAKIKKENGYPEQIGLTWAKTFSEKITPTAKILNEVGLVRAVSLSVQSFNEQTLTAIKRKNLKFNTFQELIKDFSNIGMNCYTELIIGLPEETVESFKDSWEILAPLDPQPVVIVRNCSVFVNAPMNNPEYLKKYKIIPFTTPQFMQHTEIKDKNNEIVEYEQMVHSTNTLPNDKMQTVYMINWMMMVFHIFGVTEMISKYYNKAYELSYKIFYEVLMKYMENSNSLFNQEYKIAKKHCKNGYEGKGWDYYDTTIGNISWPIEEASWIHLIQDSKKLEKEIFNFITYLNTKLNCKVNEFIVKDLTKYQIFVLNFPENRFYKKQNQEFLIDWGFFFSDNKSEISELVFKKIKLSKKTKILEIDPIKWNYETIWYGRRSCKYKTKILEMTYE